MLPPSRRAARPRALALALALAAGFAATPLAAEQTLEDAILESLTRHGFALQQGVAGPRAPDRLVWRDVGYTTIDGGVGRVDFVLRASAFDRPVWVETARQRTRGAPKARLPDRLRNAAEAFPDVRVVLVRDGDGGRPGARAIRTRPVEVMTLAGFRDWLARRLDGDTAPFGADAAPGSGYLPDTVRE